MQSLALCWMCSTSLFQTSLKLPRQKERQGKEKQKRSHKQLSAALCRSSITRAASHHVPCPCTLLLGKHLPMLPRDSLPCPGLGEADLPADSCGAVWSTGLENWKCLDRQMLLGINCSLACLITPSQSNSLVYVLQLVTALHSLFKLSCPFYKYSIEAP